MADQRENDVRSIMKLVANFCYEEAQSMGDSSRVEGLQIVSQVLSEAYGISDEEVRNKPEQSLLEIFAAYAQSQPQVLEQQQQQSVPNHSTGYISLGQNYDLPAEAGQEDKEKAEDLKNQGNEHMKNSQWTEALQKYTSAIILDGRNAAYFCNRAAAYVKLEKFDTALRDCQIALHLKPDYARAYGRMGVVFSSQNKHADAILCYKKAIELDPTTESFVQNLRYSQQAVLEELPGGQPQSSQGIQAFLNNPSLINMASQMLQDPSMQQMMQQFMNGFQQSGSGGDARANPIENLLEMGQSIANQIRNTNPQLAEQLIFNRDPSANPDAEGNGGNNGGASGYS